MEESMKRFMMFGLALLLLGPTLFADHANVMPARVGRFFIAPTFITFDREFNTSGERTGSRGGDEVPSTRMFNLGFALEYGITSWITGAIQWAPGINLWSDVDTDIALPGLHSSSGAVISDMGDIFVGAKIQIIGPAAPIASDRFRLAFGPGLKIPLPGPDFRDEIGNNTPNVATIDNHVLGLGLRSYFDWVVSEFFYLNLYNEVIFYPIRGRYRDLGFGQAMMSRLGASADVDFRYELTFEIEPTFTYRLQDPTIALELGLPFTYFFTPGYSVSNVRDAVFSPTPGVYLPVHSPSNQGEVHRLSFGPNVSAFFMEWPVPLEFRLSYSIPLWGINTPVRHVVGLQVRAYFRI